MRHRDAPLRQQALEALAHSLDRIDLVVQEDLAAALELPHHRLADQSLRPGRHERLDRKALLRRRGDDREVANPSNDSASVRGMGVAVRVATSTSARRRLSAPSCCTPKRDALVDDRQAQALELHLLRKELVRADDDIDLAGFQLLHDVGRFLGVLKREFRNVDRPVGEPVLEGLEVLLGEQRRRAQDHDLLLVGDGDERGTQRDLGLAEAHVAADQAIHGLAGGHVGHDRLDRRGLVGRLLEAEARGKRPRSLCSMEKA